LLVFVSNIIIILNKKTIFKPDLFSKGHVYKKIGKSDNWIGAKLLFKKNAPKRA
jgi:hypothetical protein